MKHKTIYSTIILVLGLVMLAISSVSKTLVLDQTGGFLQDYIGLGTIYIFTPLITFIACKYKAIIKNENLHVLKTRLGRFIYTLVLLGTTLIINHQWVMSQMNNTQNTWFSSRGKIPYILGDTLELFNLNGLLFYGVCCLFWASMLSAALDLLSSMVMLLTKHMAKKKTRFENDQYSYCSAAVVMFFLCYYIGLQANDLAKEGITTFELNRNRLILIFVSLLFMVTYIIILAIIRAFKQNAVVRIKNELFSEVFFILAPFVALTILSIYLRKRLNLEVYLIYSIFAFAVLVLTIVITCVSQFFKVKKSQRIEAVLEENKFLVTYTKHIESLYREMRAFKHDHNNMMLSMGHYMDNDDLEGLKKHHSHLMTASIQAPQYQLVNKLILVYDSSLKGVLLNKLSLCHAEGIDLCLDIHDFSLAIDPVDLTRIFGILLDNAIEAARESSTKALNMVLLKDQVIIGNSYEGDLVVEGLYTYGHSSKGQGRGIGLHSLKEVLDKYPYTIKTTVDGKYFTQKIILKDKA